VKWLVDAQLPLALAVAIRMTGRDVRHTLDLPRANATTDDGIRELVLREDRIVITKDRGFRASHVLNGRPKRLVFVTPGNIRNAQLVPLFVRNLAVIEEAFGKGHFVEFGLDGIRVQE
jgi:predicted nuclease of predicted toxin-antitoxin system